MIELNKIYNMDCLEFMKKLSDKSIDIMLIDPPYGINIGKMNFTQSGAIKVGGAYRNDYTEHDCSWDKDTLNKEIIDEIFRVSILMKYLGYLRTRLFLVLTILLIYYQILGGG